MDSRKGEIIKGGKGKGLGGLKGGKGGKKGDGKQGRKGEGHKGGKKGNEQGYRGPSSTQRAYPYPHSRSSGYDQQGRRSRQAPQGLPVFNNNQLKMPSLSEQIGRGICLSYDKVERGLIDVLQQHRHRTNLPSNIQQIIVNNKDTIPVPLNGSDVEIKIQSEPQEAAPMDVDGTSESVAVLLLSSSSIPCENSVLTHDFSVLTTLKDGIPKLIKGPIQSSDNWKSAAIAALNQHGVDCSDISTWTEFSEFQYGDGNTTKVVIPHIWEPSVFHCSASTDCFVSSIAELLQAKEDSSKESFETVASADLFAEYLEKVNGPKLISYLKSLTEPREHNDSYESELYQPGLFSIVDQQFASPSPGTKTGIVDVERLSAIAAASGEFLSQNEILRLLTNIVDNNNVAWYDNSLRPVDSVPKKKPTIPAVATPSKAEITPSEEPLKEPETPLSQQESGDGDKIDDIDE